MALSETAYLFLTVSCRDSKAQKSIFVNIRDIFRTDIYFWHHHRQFKTQIYIFDSIRYSLRHRYLLLTVLETVSLFLTVSCRDSFKSYSFRNTQISINGSIRDSFKDTQISIYMTITETVTRIQRYLLMTVSETVSRIHRYLFMTVSETVKRTQISIFKTQRSLSVEGQRYICRCFTDR